MTQFFQKNLFTRRSPIGLKTLLINVFVLCAFLVLVNVSSAIILKYTTGIATEPKTYDLPNVLNREQVKQVDKEIFEMEITYAPFTGWTAMPMKGKYVNIDELGNRKHKHHLSPTSPRRSVACFGGSTMWGVGSIDDETIPAYLDSLNTAFQVENFADLGFNSRQGLEELINQYARGAKFDYVVFYDGVNEVQMCRGELSPFEHLRAAEYQKKIGQGDVTKSSETVLYALKYIFYEKTAQLIEHVKLNNFDTGDYRLLYDCYTNRDKAKAIARSLIENWEIARSLVKNNGGEFIAILQPQAFQGSPNLGHLEGSPLLRGYMSEQYHLVYSEVLTIIEEESIDWVTDLTDIFDVEEMIYLDFCHTTNAGNLMVADTINQLLSLKD